jgi:molybdopterin-binding protein
MKLSARNMLPGKVVAVTKGATTAHVKVELASGLTVMSSITNEAVDDLALKIGDSVSAVIKSSDEFCAVVLPDQGGNLPSL